MWVPGGPSIEFWGLIGGPSGWAPGVLGPSRALGGRWGGDICITSPSSWLLPSLGSPQSSYASCTLGLRQKEMTNELHQKYNSR